MPPRSRQIPWLDYNRAIVRRSRGGSDGSMRNLLGRLHERTPGSLAGIARFWAVDLRGRDVHQDVGQLFRVMTDPWTFAMTSEQLEPEQRELLDHLVQKSGGWTGHSIAEELEREYAEIREDLRELYRAGFVFAEQAEAGVDERGEAHLFVPREVHAMLRRIHEERQRTDPDRCSLDHLLGRLDDHELAEIAERLGYTVVPAVAMRADLIQYLRPRLSDPKRIARVQEYLDWPASALYEWLETVGRSYPASARSSLGMSVTELRQAIHELVLQGLIWRGYDEGGKLEIVFPTVVREPQPVPEAPVPDLEVIDAENVTEPEWVYPYATAWDLLTVLRETQAARSRALGRILADGGEDLTAAASRRLAETLWNGGDDTVPTGYLWFLSAQANSVGEGLSSRNGAPSLLDDYDPPGLTDAVRPWTRLSFAEQHERLVANWLRWSHWHEARGRDSVEVWGARWPEFRERLVERLQELEAGTWYTVASFAERFAVRDIDAIGTQFSAAINREHIDESVEARRRDVVRFVTELTLLTACAWLRLVETARSPRRGYVFRLTDVGRWSLGLRDQPPEEPSVGQHAIAVQPTFDIYLLQPEPLVVWTLSAFADLEEIDRVSTYRLTEGSIHRALDAGANADQVLLALHRFSGEVPDNVADEIRHWAMAYRRASLAWGLLIEVSHSGESARLESRLADQGFLVERLTQDRLMIRVEAQDRMESTARAVQTALRELEITGRWVS